MNLSQAVWEFGQTHFDDPYPHIWGWRFDPKRDQILTK